MSFFDDDAVQPEPAPRRPRRTTKDKARQRIFRYVILGVAAFLIILVLALVIRACRQSAKEAAYREYFTAVQTAITDSNNIGKRMGVLLTDPTRFSAREINDEIAKIAASQKEIYDRVNAVEPPGKLKDQQKVLVDGMYIRWKGAELFQQAMKDAMEGKNPKATARKLAALHGYFAGPDVYYRQLYQKQAGDAMVADGVTGVAVPTSDYYLGVTFFDRDKIEQALERIKSSAKITGIHGVGLISTVVKPANVTLSTTKDTKFESSASLTFAVTVQNQGSVTEQNVPVELTYVPPGGGAPQKASATIQSIAAGQKQTVEITGIAIDGESLSRPQTIKVVAGPVKNEQVTANNKATYTVIPVLPAP